VKEVEARRQCQSLLASEYGKGDTAGRDWLTVKTQIIGNFAWTLELPLLVRSVSQVRAEGESSHCAPSP